jgi:hypothetical protein
VYPIRTKYLNKIQVIDVRLLEQVCTSRKRLPRDTDRLTKGNLGFLKALIGVSSKFEEQTKSNDQTNNDITFMHFHFDLSP